MTSEEFVELRRKMAMSQDDLATRLDVSRRTVQNIEGSAEPVPALYQLAIERLALDASPKRAQNRDDMPTHQLQARMALDKATNAESNIRSIWQEIKAIQDGLRQRDTWVNKEFADNASKLQKLAAYIDRFAAGVDKKLAKS